MSSEHHVQFGDVGEARHPVTGQRRPGELAVIERYRLGQRPAERHDHAAFDLVDHRVAVDHGPALVGRHDPGHPDVAGCVGERLGAGRHPAALLQAGREACAAPHPVPVPPGRAAGGAPAGPPAEPLGGGLQDGGEPVVIEMTEPEAQRVLARNVRQLVDVRLARERVGGRGQGAIGALRMRGVGWPVAQPAVGNRVRVREGKAFGSGVDVEEVPRGYRAGGVQAGAHVDHRHRAQETPLEFLGPAPVHHHRPAGAAGQACGLDRLVAVLAPEPSAGRRCSTQPARSAAARRPAPRPAVSRSAAGRRAARCLSGRRRRRRCVF